MTFFHFSSYVQPKTILWLCLRLDIWASWNVACGRSPDINIGENFLDFLVRSRLNMLNNFGFHVKAQKSLSHSLIYSLSTCWTTFDFMSMLQSHSLIHSLSTWWTTFVFMPQLKSHSHTLSLAHSHTLSLTHSLIQTLSTCWTTFVFISMLKSHSLTLTLSHSHTLSLSHSRSHTLTFSLSHSHTHSIFQSFTLWFTHSGHSEQLLF